MRRGFSWFFLPAGLVAPIFMLELVLTHPTYRQNVATFFLLYAVGGAIALAIRHRRWRSLLWMPTWFAFAFLRRLAALEAIISLPTRPFAWRPPTRGSSAEVPGKARSVALRA